MDSPVEIAHFDGATDDPETFDGWMRAAYIDYRRSSADDPAGCSFSFTRASAGVFSIATVHHGGRFAADTESLGSAIVVVTGQAGRTAVSTGDLLVECETDRPALLPPGRPWGVVGEAFTNEVVRIERSALDAAAAGLGWAGGEVRFGGGSPDGAVESYLARTLAHVRDAVLYGFDTLPPLIAAESARTLATAVLLTFPSNVVDDPAGPAATQAGGSAPSTVRRAVEFIDSHAHEDIGIDQIAEAARVGPRGLQASFRRHRDQTPLGYLRRTRMESAHRDLRAGDPTRGDTVADIAARWGFTHAGRFSVEYRRAFGSSPSYTLRH